MDGSDRVFSTSSSDADADAYAGDLATEVPEAARRCFGRAVEALLGHRADLTTHLDAALAADPGLPAAHLLKGFATKTLARRRDAAAVRGSLARAGASLARREGAVRETRLAEALAAWLEGRPDLAAGRLDDHLGECPRDLFAMKLAQSIRFMMGDAPGMRESVARLLPAFVDEDPGFGFVLGCHSFALEENGALDEAEREGRRACEMQPDDAWGAHAVAHVLYHRRRFDDGLAWLTDRRSRLTGLSNFAGHLAWHEALLHVERGRPERALELFDRDISIYPPRDYRDVSNATSLLILLEGRGAEVGNRWERLADIARDRLGDHGLAFADIHYVLALAGSGDVAGASTFLRSMRRSVAARTDFDASVARDVGVELGEAIVEARSGRSRQARAAVRRLGGRVSRIGGSRAQRRVMSWVLDASLAVTDVGHA